MFIALGVLLGLVSLCPAILIVGGTFLPCLIPLLVATGLILIALNLPPIEAQRFGKLIQPLVICAAIPALWMLAQMLPLPLSHTAPWAILSSLAHPVWASVATGFTSNIAGSVSIDIGATATALVRYLSIVGVILLATSVTINRDRAEAVLVGLTAATVLISFVLIGADAFDAGPLAAPEEALNCACLGLIFSATCAWLIFERQETRRSKLGLRETRFVYSMLACLAAFLVCAGAIAATRSGSLIFAASCGFGMFCAVFLVRRLNLGRWGAGAIGVTASVIAIALVSGAAGHSADLRLAFVKKDPASIELTQRILADTPFLGDGAGTFGSLLPIYRSTSDGAREGDAVTASARLSVEMGRPVLWAAVIAAIISVIYFLRAAAKRGRDSFYPASAASCLVTLIILAFVNVGLFGAALPALSAVILGLGLAQSQSRIQA
ncbi:MAG: hypothetical protein WDN46_07515 [Methylocella sp.]